MLTRAIFPALTAAPSEKAGCGDERGARGGGAAEGAEHAVEAGHEAAGAAVGVGGRGA